MKHTTFHCSDDTRLQELPLALPVWQPCKPYKTMVGEDVDARLHTLGVGSILNDNPPPPPFSCDQHYSRVMVWGGGFDHAPQHKRRRKAVPQRAGRHARKSGRCGQGSEASWTWSGAKKIDAGPPPSRGRPIQSTPRHAVVWLYHRLPRA